MALIKAFGSTSAKMECNASSCHVAAAVLDFVPSPTPHAILASGSGSPAQRAVPSLALLPIPIVSCRAVRFRDSSLHQQGRHHHVGVAIHRPRRSPGQLRADSSPRKAGTVQKGRVRIACPNRNRAEFLGDWAPLYFKLTSLQINSASAEASSVSVSVSLPAPPHSFAASAGARAPSPLQRALRRSSCQVRHRATSCFLSDRRPAWPASPVNLPSLLWSIVSHGHGADGCTRPPCAGD